MKKIILAASAILFAALIGISSYTNTLAPKSISTPVVVDASVL